ncbi:MAG: protein-export chaperone SecB [Syntrophobacteraceae bacterium]
MPAQLEIKDVRVLKIEYSFGPENVSDKQNAPETTDEQSADVKFHFQTESLMHEQQQLLKVMLGAKVTGPRENPFSLLVDIGGIFSIDGQLSPDELDRLRHINCNAILFPYLRETVSEITRRGGMAPLYLPIVNFVQLYRDGIFKKEQESNPPS